MPLTADELFTAQKLPESGGLSAEELFGESRKAPAGFDWKKAAATPASTKEVQPPQQEPPVAASLSPHDQYLQDIRNKPNVFTGEPILSPGAKAISENWIAQIPIAGDIVGGMARAIGSTDALISRALDPSIAPQAIGATEDIRQGQNAIAGGGATGLARKAIAGVAEYGALGGTKLIAATAANEALQRGQEAGLKGFDLAGYSAATGVIMGTLGKVLERFGLGKDVAQRTFLEAAKRLPADAAKNFAQNAAIGGAQITLDKLAGVDPSTLSKEQVLDILASSAAFTFAGHAAGLGRAAAHSPASYPLSRPGGLKTPPTQSHIETTNGPTLPSSVPAYTNEPANLPSPTGQRPEPIFSGPGQSTESVQQPDVRQPAPAPQLASSARPAAQEASREPVRATTPEAQGTVAPKTPASKEIKKGLAQLKNHYGVPFYEVSAPETADASDAIQFAKKAGLTVAWAKSDGDEPFSGMNVGSSIILHVKHQPPPGDALIQVGIGGGVLTASEYLPALVAHEVSHGTGFDLHSKFDKDVVNEAADRYLKAASGLQKERFARDPEIRQREGIATLVEEFWLDPKKRAEIMQKSPSLFGRLKAVIKKTTGNFTPQDAANAEIVKWAREIQHKELPNGENPNDAPVSRPQQNSDRSQRETVVGGQAGPGGAPDSGSATEKPEGGQPEVQKGLEPRAAGIPIPGFVKKIVQEAKDLPEWSDTRKAINHWQADQLAAHAKIKTIAADLKAKVPDEETAKGIAIYIGSGGDVSKLTHWTGNSPGRPEYMKALSLSPEDKQVAADISSHFSDALKRAQSAGIDIKELPDYITQMVQKPGIASSLTGAGRKLKANFEYSKARKHESFFEGEQAGLEYEKDARKILVSYLTKLEKTIADKEFIQKLANAKMPNGEPVLSPKSRARVTPDLAESGQKSTLVYQDLPVKTQDGRMYKSLDQAALRDFSWAGKDPDNGNPIMVKSDLQVHPDFHNHLKNVLEQGAVSEWANSPSQSTLLKVGKGTVRAAAELQKIGKETMFGMLPMFHAITETIHAVGGHHINPFGIEHFDPNNVDHMDMARHGLMLGPTAGNVDYGEGLGGGRRDLAANLIGAIGGKPGKAIKDWMYDTKDWLFERYIPSLKIKTYSSALEHNTGRYENELQSGKATLDQIKNLTASQVNAAYGHLNLAETGRNPTIQAFLRATMLAPDFNEARGRFVGQALRGATGGKAGREQLYAIASLAVGQYIGTRILNQLIDGDFHLEDPFGVHNGNRRYSIRSIPSDMEDMAKDFWKFIRGRESPGVRLLDELRSGTNYRGEPSDAASAITNTLAGAIPVTLQPFVRGLSPNGKYEPVSQYEQFFGAMGLHISRVSPITDAHRLAGAWMDKHATEFGVKSEKAVYPVSQYQQLRYALEDNDPERAVGEVKKLMADNKFTAADLPKLYQRFEQGESRPFTKNSETEEAFKKSLDARDSLVVNAADKRRKVMLVRLGDVLKKEYPGEAMKFFNERRLKLVNKITSEPKDWTTEVVKKKLAAQKKLQNAP